MTKQRINLVPGRRPLSNNHQESRKYQEKFEMHIPSDDDDFEVEEEEVVETEESPEETVEVSEQADDVEQRAGLSEDVNTTENVAQKSSDASEVEQKIETPKQSFFGKIFNKFTNKK